MNQIKELQDPIKFTVGESYTNEKGVFEVISIKRNDMVIRWEDGKEITTGIDLQEKIQERRQWEKIVREKEKTAGSAKSRGASGGKPGAAFDGLKPEDFRDKISRTRWRSRNQLGGAVTALIADNRFRFNSWAAQGENAIHWADADRFKAKKDPSPARFFSSADKSSLIFGFCVKFPKNNEAEASDGSAFGNWIREPINDQWLHEVALDEGLCICDGFQKNAKILIRPQKDGWTVEGSKSMSFATVGHVVDALSKNGPVDFVIAKLIPRPDAIKMKSAVDEEIARLFNRLLPLYEGLVDHRK